MLLDLLKEKRCFKLICGAGNEDEAEVEKLVALYSKAGANLFDICPKPEIINAAKRGLERAGIKEERYICCSVGVNDDTHFCKAYIRSDLCTKCGKCKTVCLQHAVNNTSEKYIINKTRCIGCCKCFSVCSNKAIEMKSEYINLKEILPKLTSNGTDCIEFHAPSSDENEVDEKWNDINNLFDGVVSICIDRSKLGNEDILKRLNKMLTIRKPYTTIIQTDGSPMSGGKDDYKTTLQAVAMAEIIQNAKLPVYILLSGGTNSKSTELARLCNINANGIAIGSFARKIVSEYIVHDDFLENKEIFNKALETARTLVEVSLKNLG